MASATVAASAAATTLILLPHQLFPLAHVRAALAETGAKRIVVWEDPLFYGDRAGGDFGPAFLRLNGLRVAWQALAVETYVETLRAARMNAGIEHVGVDALWSKPLPKRYAAFANARVAFFDAADHLWTKRWAAHAPASVVETVVLDTPAFLLTRDQMARYAAKRTAFRHAPFFKWVRKTLDLLPDVESTDLENRARWGPGDPPIPLAKARSGARREAIERAAQWVEKHRVFGKAPRPSSAALRQRLRELPVTHRATRAWWAEFLKERFPHFGAYQDALVRGQKLMFHAGISPMLNIGLITPAEIVADVVQRAKKTQAAKNNVEGFLRQVAGWREYCRFYYTHVPPATWKRNALGAHAKLTPDWWDAAPKGGSKMPPIVADAVRDAWNDGYLHHIRRLMVVANWMTLQGIDPVEVYHWFHAFSLDAWEWVMVLNVVGMGTFADGGASTRKVYVSSDAYLVRMSDEPKGSWQNDWKDAYAAFRARCMRLRVCRLF